MSDKPFEEMKIAELYNLMSTATGDRREDASTHFHGRLVDWWLDDDNPYRGKPYSVAKPAFLRWAKENNR